MEEYEWKQRLAEGIREQVFKIPRRYREYDMVMQPVVQLSPAGNGKVGVRFQLKYKAKVYPCSFLVETDGVYAHVSGVGAYLDRLFIKGRPEVLCAEFVKWMKFARNGTVNGDYAFMFYRGTPVGFMVRPAGGRHSYAFFKKEIEECGLKADRILKMYSGIRYDGSEIDCQKMDDIYIPRQAFGKGILPVHSLELEARRSFIWSMLCNCSLKSRK